ncbi:MAG: beta-L-arabinofuranosidase domain-containing protein, partial [Paludibacter sp.]
MNKRILLILCVAVFSFFHVIAQDKLYSTSFPLGDVTLLDGPFKHARDLNITTLLKYDVDRLLAPYLKEAGLTPKGASYINWIGLDGHIGGHYLSALAINYAATGNADCKQRMDYMLAELKACQDANGVKYPSWAVGYVGGVPGSNGIWSTLKTGN